MITGNTVQDGMGSIVHKNRESTVRNKVGSRTMLLPVSATPELKAWIEEQLEQRSWSMREASIKAGLSEGRISQFLRDEGAPGIEACIKLGGLFNVPPTYVLFLAGYLERDPGRGIPPMTQKLLDTLEPLNDSPHYERMIRALLEVADTFLYSLDASVE